MELGDEILSVEQLSTYKLNQKKRQSSSAQPAVQPIKTPALVTTVPKKYAKAIVHKKEPLPSPPKIVEPIQNVMYPDPDAPDDPDMPPLEFLDMEEELQNFAPAAELDSRSPFIPGPFSDYDLKSRDINSLLADIDESELIDRAPYIPPPCIDKIVSFDDLSLPDLTDNYQDALDDSPVPMAAAGGNTTAFMEDNNFAANQMYDFGNAKVPAHLIKKFMPIISKQ